MFKFDLSFLKKINLNYLKEMSRNNILVIVAVVAIIITGGLIYANSNPGFSSISIGNFSLASIFGKSTDQIGKDVVNYINDNQLAQTPASFVSASEESGLIKVKIKIGENEFDSYATKDGKLLFPQAVEMAPQQVETKTTDTPANTTSSVQKNDKPVLEAFVVSDCPYGLQMQRAAADAVKNIPSLASSVVIRYIGSISNGQVNSMHDSDASGKAISNGPEAKENLRQICLREEQPTKYWNYISCYMKKATGTLPNTMPIGDSTSCLASTGVDTAKLNTCMTDSSKGLAYAKVDFDLSDKYNVSGSPTLFLNGTQISESSYGGRSSDGVKSMVCAGFTTESSFCSTKLNTAGAAASFSATYATASGSTSTAANCATPQ